MRTSDIHCRCLIMSNDLYLVEKTIKCMISHGFVRQFKRALNEAKLVLDSQHPLVGRQFPDWSDTDLKEARSSSLIICRVIASMASPAPPPWSSLGLGTSSPPKTWPTVTATSKIMILKGVVIRPISNELRTEQRFLAFVLSVATWALTSWFHSKSIL